MKEVTIVSAFFNIGRSNISGFNRSTQKYFDYFKVWGKIKNHLIVYTYEAMAKKVIEYRKSLGLEDRTTVVIIDDIFAEEKELYKRMKAVEKDESFLKFRLKDSIENRADYDYITFMKGWFLNKAFEDKLLKTDLTAWIDFGFNHGDLCYTKPEEFDFLWKCELSTDKIHLFTSSDHIIHRSPFLDLRYLSENLSGAINIMGTSMIPRFYQLTLKATEAMLMLGFIDDDQMVYKIAKDYEPELFTYHKSYWWFMPLKEHGAPFLTTRDQSSNEAKHISFFKKIKGRFLYEKQKVKYFLSELREYDRYFRQK
ncbi:MAG: WlaTC/HtrL family glycosyltransferase [Candidatus Saccharibacteria bacterium]|nr:WlaTC/HtrL family glycosyltransferase [Candidatus Saccharibacteria bacterium]